MCIFARIVFARRTDFATLSEAQDFFMKQIMLSELSLKIFNFVSMYFKDVVPPKQSFISQIRHVGVCIGLEVTFINIAKEMVDSKFQCKDAELTKR